MLHEFAPAGHAAAPHEADHADHGANTLFGFWVYLMTDCIIFAALFATFSVFRHSFAGGPTAKEVFELPGVAAETALLLISSITYGFAMIAAYRQKRGAVIAWLVVTFLFGLSFIGLELREFSHLVSIGAGPDRSAFLSSFFTLVATHGLHVTIGLIWMSVMMFQVLRHKRLDSAMLTRLSCLSLFWHFLDIVWICVFSFVYLMSVAL